MGWRLRRLLAVFEQRLLGASRRTALVWRARLQAWRVKSTVDITLPADLIIGRRIQTAVKPSTHTVIRLGPQSVLADDVTLLLYGGEMTAGEDCQIRRGCTLSIGGRLVLEGGNPLSYGTVIHCGQSIRFGRMTGLAEYCTVSDNTHFYTEPEKGFHHNTLFAPVELGQQVFLAPRVAVGRGVTIGDFTIVGPNSSVAKDLPPGVFASGSPARVVRSLDLPWLESWLADRGTTAPESNGSASRRQAAMEPDNPAG